MATVRDAAFNDGKDVSKDERTFAITPSDTLVFEQATDAIYVGVAGDVSFYDLEGNLITQAFEVGWHPIKTNRVMSTNTDATDLLGQTSRTMWR